MIPFFEKKVHIRSKADWYRINPEQAARVEELVVASSVGDQFVIGEGDIDFEHSFPRLKHLSVWKYLSQSEWNHIARLPLRTLNVCVDALPESITMPELRELIVFVREESFSPMELEILRTGGTHRSIDLSGCISLEWLTIRHVPDLDIRCLSGLSTLRKLVLYGTVLSDLSPLTAIQLTSLSFSNCYLRDVSGLERIETLQNIDLSYNDIENAAALCVLPHLQKLYLRKNPLKDERAVRELFHGQELIISEHEYQLKRIESDISRLKLEAGKILFNSLRGSMNSTPESFHEKVKFQKLMEWDYTELMKDRIVTLARLGIKQLSDKGIRNADGFDYTEFYIDTLRETYPFLKDENL